MDLRNFRDSVFSRRKMANKIYFTTVYQIAPIRVAFYLFLLLQPAQIAVNWGIWGTGKTGSKFQAHLPTSNEVKHHRWSWAEVSHPPFDFTPLT